MKKEIATLGLYSKMVIQLLSSPGKFFDNPDKRFRMMHPAGFLLISTILFTTASLCIVKPDNQLMSSIVLFSNAFGMVLALSIIGYTVMGASIGRKTSFGLFFSVYAYASGTTLLAAWIPYTLVFTEPWRWVLIGIGLKKTCGLGVGAIIWVILCSITILSILLWSILLL